MHLGKRVCPVERLQEVGKMCRKRRFPGKTSFLGFELERIRRVFHYLCVPLFPFSAQTWLQGLTPFSNSDTANLTVPLVCHHGNRQAFVNYSNTNCQREPLSLSPKTVISKADGQTGVSLLGLQSGRDFRILHHFVQQKDCKGVLM